MKPLAIVTVIAAGTGAMAQVTVRARPDVKPTDRPEMMPRDDAVIKPAFCMTPNDFQGVLFVKSNTVVVLATPAGGIKTPDAGLKFAFSKDGSCDGLMSAGEVSLQYMNGQQMCPGKEAVLLYGEPGMATKTCRVTLKGLYSTDKVGVMPLDS
ncbi:hypothetical protein PQU92_09605 [Asticcacaulis sp. BYS171W]|uniref:Uncharacterized protein n=1 Tax=Asticcacaulis aquaticus TaxID=2984212 RepID=A0ABT5HTY0_9CAUL|nr:hypothetical protein [Asticcacaulis aquaticus]MDC7683531.1 hypothetical protein [Asticcacaulis aquaticus]